MEGKQLTTDQSTEQELAPLNFVDEMHELSHKQLVNFITQRNSLVGKVNAAAGDRVTLTEQIRESDDDPEIVAARERMSEAVLALDALVKPKVDAIIADSAGSQEQFENEIKELDQRLKPGLTYYKKLYDVGGKEPSKHLPAQDRLKGTTIRSGAGGRRIRGFAVEITIDGQTERFDNFSTAATYLDVETADLQKEFFDKAGTTTLKDVPDVVNMTLEYVEVDEDGNETPKEAFVKAVRVEAEEKKQAEESNAQAAEVEAEDDNVVSINVDDE